MRRKEVGGVDLPLLGVNLSEGVKPRTEDDGRPAPSEDLSKYLVVHEGDVIMNKLGKPHGSVGLSRWHGITSPAYWVLRVDRAIASPRFVHHLLRSRQMVREYERLGKFMPPNQFDISFGSFQNITVAMPELHEQNLIADVLDRMDQAVERGRGEMRLLEERRRSLTVALVTGQVAVSEATT